jgi:hypothetical protein
MRRPSGHRIGHHARRPAWPDRRASLSRAKHRNAPAGHSAGASCIARRASRIVHRASCIAIMRGAHTKRPAHDAPAFRSTIYNVEALLPLLGRLLRRALLLRGGLAARLLRCGLPCTLLLGSHISFSSNRSETARPIPRWIGGRHDGQTAVPLHGLGKAREVEVTHLERWHHDVASLFRAREANRLANHLEVVQHEER